MTRAIYLVGSVPLTSTAEVFETVETELGARIRRLPDGETGIRSNWIAWQRAILRDHPALQELEPDARGLPNFTVKSDVVGPIEFGPLGYAEAALASYHQFVHLKQSGKIATDKTFQVSLPTTTAAVCNYIDPGSQAAVEPGYRRRLLAELETIVNGISHGDLAVQWDVAVEFNLLEGITKVHFEDVWTGVIDRLINCCQAVPADVEMGLHLCYGDSGHKHFKEPEDTSLLVRVANEISGRVNRPISWIHMPVPRDRHDAAYFMPLRDLSLHAETELVLGLVHYTDGIEGARRRITAAETVVKDFAIATECGLGRRASDTIPKLLRLHAAVADE